MRFPGESDDYRAARDELLQAEVDLRRLTEAVAAQRRELPLGGGLASDYQFQEWDAATASARGVRFSELLPDGKDTLFLYSFMYNPGPAGPLEVPCPVCTSIIDGIDGAAPHIASRIGFAVASKAPIERFGAHAHARGWRNVRLLSTAGTTFNGDYNAEVSDDEQNAMAHVFTRRDGKIHHFWSSEIWSVANDDGLHPRHVDFMWPLWAVLDTTPGGRGAWMPDFVY